MRIGAALAKTDEFTCSSRGLFVLGIPQVVDSFIAGPVTDEAVEWLAKKRNRVGRCVKMICPDSRSCTRAYESLRAVVFLKCPLA